MYVSVGLKLLLVLQI